MSRFDSGLGYCGGCAVTFFDPCPNAPPCAHLSGRHDVPGDYEDPAPVCCVDGCDCGAQAIRQDALAEEIRAGVASLNAALAAARERREAGLRPD